MAQKFFEEREDQGTLHYCETGDGEREIIGIYDVTETDDPFNPENEPSEQENPKQENVLDYN